LPGECGVCLQGRPRDFGSGVTVKDERATRHTGEASVAEDGNRGLSPRSGPCPFPFTPKVFFFPGHGSDLSGGSQPNNDATKDEL